MAGTEMAADPVLKVIDELLELAKRPFVKAIVWLAEIKEVGPAELKLNVPPAPVA